MSSCAERIRGIVLASAVLIAAFAAPSARAEGFDLAVRAGNGWVTQIYKSAADIEDGVNHYVWDVWPVFVSYDWAISIRPAYFLGLDVEAQLVTFGGDPTDRDDHFIFLVSTPFLPRERSVVRPLLRLGVGNGGYGASSDFGSSWKSTTNLIVAIGATARTGKLFDWVLEVRGSYDFRDESTRDGNYSAKNVEGELLPAYSVEIHVGVEFSVIALARKIKERG
jgi:hypothetical protein